MSSKLCSRSIDGAPKSSMDVVELNALVINLRKLTKKAKVHVMHKLSRDIKRHKERHVRTSKELFIRKANNILEELNVLKTLDIDQVTKFCLANTSTSVPISTSNLSMKAMLRVATAKSELSAEIVKWRNTHEDWSSMAAFMLSKNTGRRIKKNKKVKRNGAVERLAERPPNMSIGNTAVTKSETANLTVEEVEPPGADIQSEPSVLDFDKASAKSEKKSNSQKQQKPRMETQHIKTELRTSEMVIKPVDWDTLDQEESQELVALKDDLSFLFGQSDKINKKRHSGAFFLGNDSESDSSEGGSESSNEDESDGIVKDGRSLFMSTLGETPSKRRKKLEKPTKTSKALKQPNTKKPVCDVKSDSTLHPSWQASLRRKQQTTIMPSQGKKITFDDDD